jgi:chorismate synthase
LCGALASIPAIKGVEVGRGFAAASLRGSQVHDEIYFDGDGLYRKTNRAGGIEAGMTNGETLVLRAAMKPIATLGRQLATVDTSDMSEALAFKERADVCAVPAASVVAEAVVAFVLACVAQEKFGGDSMGEMMRNFDGYLSQIEGRWKKPADRRDA